MPTTKLEAVRTYADNMSEWGGKWAIAALAFHALCDAMEADDPEDARRAEYERLATDAKEKFHSGEASAISIEFPPDPRRPVSESVRVVKAASPPSTMRSKIEAVLCGTWSPAMLADLFDRELSEERERCARMELERCARLVEKMRSTPITTGDIVDAIRSGASA